MLRKNTGSNYTGCPHKFGPLAITQKLLNIKIGLIPLRIPLGGTSEPYQNQDPRLPLRILKLENLVSVETKLFFLDRYIHPMITP